jgi:hypothetical protein
VEKLQEKRQLGRPRIRWEDNVKIKVQEMGWRLMDCTGLSQDSDTCKRGNELSGFTKLRELLD